MLFHARAAAMATFAAIVLLAGCASPVPLATHPAADAKVSAPDPHVADRRLVPPDLVFTLGDGARLPARVWRPSARPAAVILALHGFNDSRDAWELPAPVLAARGIAVYAPDQRGFGGAPDRGRWPSTDRLVSDAAELAGQVAAREPGVPLFVMGESMGGAVALLLAATRPDLPVAGTVLLAPAVWSRAQMSPVMTASLWAAATFFPDWQLTGRELPLHITASDNRAALFRLAFDPLTIRGTRTGTLRGLVNLMTRAQDAAPRLRGRVLLAYGARDQLVPPDAMAAAWDAMPRTVRRSLYPAGYHLLMRDRRRDAVIADVAGWIFDPGQSLPSGGDLSAATWAASRPWDAAVPVWLPSSLDSVADTR
jgi:acylglycerol lipase